MFALVSLMCLYLGIGNIRKAFAAPFSRWRRINYMLLVSGIVLVPVGLACMWQAIKDYKAAGEEARKKAEKEAAMKKRQFFYDDEEDFQEEDGDLPKEDERVSGEERNAKDM